MRSFVTCAVLASVATLAAAVAHPLFEYPETVPLAKRQDPGTPQYACHENCGLAITFSRQEGYCSNAEWTSRYDACMVCANTYNIWQYYSNSVSRAATGCGLTASPSPSGGAAVTTAAETTAAAPSSTAAPEPATTSTSAAAPPASSSSAAAPASSTSAAAPATTLTTAASSAASGAATPSSSAAGTSKATTTRVTSIGTSVVIPSGTPTSSIVFAGAARNAGAFGAVGLVGLVLAAL